MKSSIIEYYSSEKNLTGEKFGGSTCNDNVTGFRHNEDMDGVWDIDERFTIKGIVR
ncbi:hypothetical protein [Desulfosediminicola flagellatus]|uniref:hypothetical protein n=1 Tax=Desulfosediminicola flagellatus TaxID=2569541 RepID=UPI00129487B5|nr:hypothetical protein [Desulfosediminicola flagellatus]